MNIKRENFLVGSHVKFISLQCFKQELWQLKVDLSFELKKASLEYNSKSDGRAELILRSRVKRKTDPKHCSVMEWLKVVALVFMWKWNYEDKVQKLRKFWICLQGYKMRKWDIITLAFNDQKKPDNRVWLHENHKEYWNANLDR